MKIPGVRAMCRAVSWSLFALIVARALTAPASAQTSTVHSNPAAVEQGKFILHKFEQPIGEETYQISRDGDSLDVKMDFKFTDRGTPVPMTAAFRSAAI